MRGSDLARFDEFTRANLKALEGELDTAHAEALWDEALGSPAVAARAGLDPRRSHAGKPPAR